MVHAGRRLIGQMVLGGAERRRFAVAEVLEKLDMAAGAAGMDSLILWPSHDAAIDRRVREHVRKLGLELYLWLPALADAGVDPKPGEMTEDAWGDKGHGRSGAWRGLGHGDESFLFACPRSVPQMDAALRRCREELPEYDGVFLDRIRYPSFANGLETQFTCFCRRCRREDPDWEARREKVETLRRSLATADAGLLRAWGDVRGLYGSVGLEWLPDARAAAIGRLVGTLSRQARDLGKKVGLDLFTPSLAPTVGQRYRELAEQCDWIKPMSYCHAKGPAGIPLELASLARGIMAWGPGLDEADVVAFVARSFSLPGVPAGIGELENGGVDEAYAGREYAIAAGMAGCPVYPGFECVRHPDFDLDMTEDGVRRYLAALTDAPGAVLSWNILYSPEPFLRIAGKF